MVRKILAELRLISRPSADEPWRMTAKVCALEGRVWLLGVSRVDVVLPNLVQKSLIANV